MDWDAWVKRPGLAPVALDFVTPELTLSISLANQYITLAGHGSPDKASDFKTFYSNLRVIFLNQLMSRLPEVTVDIMAQIDKDQDITHTKDPECLQRWLPMSILKNYQPAIEVAHTFVQTVGRQKYIVPIYKALLDSNQKTLAVTWFNENVKFYHPLALQTLKKMLGITAESEEVFLQV